MSARSMHKDMMARGAHCALMAVRCFFALALIGGAFAIILGLMPVCVVGSTGGALGECALGAGVAWADDEQIDVSKQCSLTLKFTEDGKVAPGAKFYAVKVADVTPDGTFKNFTDWFASYSDYLENTSKWNAVAYNAKNDMPVGVDTSYVANVKISADKNSYEVKFSDAGVDFYAGLYLVYADPYDYYGVTTYEFYPALVQLPSNVGSADEPEWLYDVTCYIKPLGDPLTLDGSAGGGSGGGGTGGGGGWSFPDIDWSSSISFDFPEDLIEEIINGGGAGSGTSGGSGGKYTSSIITGNKNSGSVSSIRNAKLSLVSAGGSSQSRVVTGATEARLPQTGLLVWPVVVLVVAGLWLICLGVIRHKNWAAREARTCEPEAGGGGLD